MVKGVITQGFNTIVSADLWIHVKLFVTMLVKKG